MPTAFKVLELLSVDLRARKALNHEVIIPMFSDALKQYEFYLQEADMQPMTPHQFFTHVLLTGEHNITRLLHDHWGNTVLQKLYLITLEAAEEAGAQYTSQINDRLLPLSLDQFKRDIIDNNVGEPTVIALPLTIDYYVKVFQYDPNAAGKFENMAQSLKKYYKPQSNVDIDAIINTLSSFIKINHNIKNREGISPFRFAIETFELIMHPDFIQQKNTNLCGVAALLIVLLRYSPHIYLNIVSDLYLHGKSLTYFEINLPENIAKRDYFYEYVMIGIKRSTSYFGYAPDNALLEPFGGLTRPCTLVNYLESLGYSEIQENVHVKNMNNSPIGVFHQYILGGVYSDHHNNEQPNDQFLRKLEFALADGKAVILSVGPSQWTFTQEQAGLGYLLSWVNVRSDHFVTLIELKSRGNNQVDFCIADSAKGGYIKHTLTEQEFISVVNGAIICDPPKPPPKLHNTVKGSFI